MANTEFYDFCRTILDEAREKGIPPEKFRHYLDERLEDYGISEQELLDRSNNLDKLTTEELVRIARMPLPTDKKNRS